MPDLEDFKMAICNVHGLSKYVLVSNNEYVCGNCMQDFLDTEDKNIISEIRNSIYKIYMQQKGKENV